MRRARFSGLLVDLGLSFRHRIEQPRVVVLHAVRAWRHIDAHDLHRTVNITGPDAARVRAVPFEAIELELELLWAK